MWSFQGEGFSDGSNNQIENRYKNLHMALASIMRAAEEHAHDLFLSL